MGGGNAPRRSFRKEERRRRLVAASRNKTARGYGRWLCWLRQKGLLDPALAPGARVTRPLVADYVATLSASCAPYTVVCRLQELYDALRVLAPETDWRWLAELWMRLGRRAEPAVTSGFACAPHAIWSISADA